MRTLNEAVAALQALRDQEEQDRRDLEAQREENKRQREVNFAAAFAAYLQAREGVDLTSPDAEALVEAEEFGSAPLPHYEVSVRLCGGWVEPLGAAFLTTQTMTGPGSYWESRGWRAHYGQNCWTDSATFLGACLAVYENAQALAAQDALAAEADA